MKKLTHYLPVVLLSLFTTSCFSAQQSLNISDASSQTLITPQSLSGVSLDNDINQDDINQDDINQDDIDQKEEANDPHNRKAARRNMSDDAVNMTAFNMRDIGLQFLKAGQYDAAKKSVGSALIILKKHYGLGAFQTAEMMVSLAAVHVLIDECAPAKDLLEKALPVFKSHYGEDHLETAETMEILANTFRGLKDYKNAKMYLEKVLAIKEKHGIGDPKKACTMESLGLVLYKLKQYEEAEDYLVDVCQIYIKEEEQEAVIRVRGHLKKVVDAFKQNK